MGWGIVYYAKEAGDVPADDFLDACPSKVEATILAVLEAVRAAPPPSFSGGGKWEAMHGSMGGYYEIRVTGPGRRHYRLFCLLDNGSPDELVARGFDRPQIVVITGMVKNHRETFSDRDYAKVHRLGEDYKATAPRRIATS
jgi:Txe/YoeB family toxin of Txe-Axe toxin-antitoxin module